MLLNLNRFAFPVFLKETRLLTALALPMLLAQVAQVGIGFVDTVMAGGAGKEDLAAVALGSSAFSTIYITFMGVMAALNPMIAQLYGAGKTEEVGKTGMQGIWFGLCLGVFGMLLMWAMITPFRHWLTLNNYVEDTMAQYMFFTSLAMPAAMIHRALHAYASSLNRPRVIMLVSFAAFALNVPLNYVFVYGKFGMPALGGAGCGVATAAVFWFSALALWLYITKEKFFRPFGLTAKIGKPDLAAFKQIWKIGAPIGLSYFLEASAFSFIVFLVAPFGEDYVAAQQVVISLSG
ncbi:MATE family efflux transporter, partial [Neisseria sp. P0021.S006]